MLQLRFLRSIAVWIGIVAATVVFGVPAIPAAFLPPRGDWFLLFARGWARTILWFSGISVLLLHTERLPGNRSLVVAANHESFADILVLLARLPVQARFLAKRGIFRVPILGWSIRAAGFVPVDRGDRVRSLATVETALARLKKGRSLVVFPEETRTRTGELLPFKKGAALLALRSGLPILPVGIAGTRRILARGAWRMTPGRVVLSVGEPIEVEGRPVKERGDVTRLLRETVAGLREEAAKELSAVSSQLSAR
jgi:1-acyl-sn-glycerol-3-phosphate acyltransferase